MLLPMAFALTIGSAQAKDLSGRVGVGFNHNFGDRSTISIRYALPLGDPAVQVQVEGFGGLAINNANAGWFIAGGRALGAVVVEDNLNLYLAAGAGYMTDGTQNTSALRLQPAMGVEFFLFGLENLGFMTEWGVNVDLGSVTGLCTAANAGFDVLDADLRARTVKAVGRPASKLFSQDWTLAGKMARAVRLGRFA